MTLFYVVCIAAAVLALAKQSKPFAFVSLAAAGCFMLYALSRFINSGSYYVSNPAAALPILILLVTMAGIWIMTGLSVLIPQRSPALTIISGALTAAYVAYRLLSGRATLSVGFAALVLICVGPVLLNAALYMGAQRAAEAPKSAFDPAMDPNLTMPPSDFQSDNRQ